MRDQHLDVGIANNGTYSSSFQIPDWAVFVGAYFPNIDAGDVGLEWSLDNSTFTPVLDPSDGNDVVLLTSGQDPGVVDISDFVRFVTSDAYLRFTCAAQSSGAVTTVVSFRG